MNRDPRAGETRPIYAFGPFRLDPAERILLRDGQPVALTPKAFDLLSYLVEHHGRLVEKQTLLSAVWPDAIVEEGNLAYNVSTLRKALGDGREDARFIETVPTRGYRFVAPVTVSSIAPSDATAIPQRGDPRISRVRFSTHRIGVGVAALALLTGALLFFTRGRTTRTPTETTVAENTLTRLTANPAEQSVRSARISPDGKYLAYADATGIRVRRIDGGETHSIPDTFGMYVLGWTGNGEKVRAGACTGASCTGWDVPITGGPRTPNGATWSNNERPDISANGSEFLTVTETGAIAVTRLNGSTPQRVVGAGGSWGTRAAARSVDGSRVFFTSDEGTRIQSVSVHGGATSLLHAVPKGWTLRSVGPVLADGRLLFVTAQEASAKPFLTSPAQAIWQVDTAQTDSRSDAARVTEWRHEDIEQVSASTDGKRIAFLSTEQQSDVYTAAFDPRTARLDTPTRLTRDDRNDVASAWMPDNATVLFYSSRNGSSDVFRQRFDSDIAIPVAAGPGNQFFPRITGDGRWVLFNDDGGADHRPGIKRLPLTGGVPEDVTPPIDGVLHCAPHGRCVLMEQRANGAVVSSFDPLRGRGAVLSQSDSDAIPGASLSGDGNQWAFIIWGESGTPQRIRILPFDGGSGRDIIVRNTGRTYTLDWLPTGGGFFTCEPGEVGFFSVAELPQRSKLMFVPMDGQAKTLWAPENLMVNWAIPSQDGRRVAINAISRRSNAWMVSGS